VRGAGDGPGGAVPAAGDRPLPTLEAVERAHIETVLAAVDGHRGNAARTLGISERNLYRKLRDYQLLS
jgi:DNA-binding NtrC family response regulator